MFGLGVLVGRGSSPVLFETRPFQEHLGQMVQTLSGKQPEKKKLDLEFYDRLDEPVSYPGKGKADNSEEITPAPETGKTASITPVSYNPQVDAIPVKRSRKLATWHQAGQGGFNGGSPVSPSPKSVLLKTKTKAGDKQTVSQPAPGGVKTKIQTGKKTEAVHNETSPDTGNPPAPVHGAYTIQVASYKTLDDALAQMVLLNKKGIDSYRASVKINGQTWYRVRIGSFASHKAAGARLEKLVASGVNGMVIKKE